MTRAWQIVRLWLVVLVACVVWFGLAVSVSAVYNVARFFWWLSGGTRASFEANYEHHRRCREERDE